MRFAVCISGGGGTLHNLWKHEDRGELAGKIVGVVSSRDYSDNAWVHEECNQRKLPRLTMPPKSYAAVGADFHACLAELFDLWNIDLVLFAGYTVFWQIPDRYLGRVLNIHPSLLPKYGGKGMYGLRVHKAVLASGDPWTGCTVHFADNQYDHGPIILQRHIVVHNNTPETLQERVFKQECLAYPLAINLVTEFLTLPSNLKNNLTRPHP